MKTLIDELKTNLGYYFSEALNEVFVTPHWVFFSLSHRCNFNCQMCGVKGILTEHELDIDLLKKSLDEVAAWGKNCTVLFTGGEVFLRKDIFEIIAYAVSLGLKTEVVTNGSLIQDVAIAGKIIGSGLSNIAVSLDGALPETHDYIRGTNGAFLKAVNALRLLSAEKKARGVGPQVSIWTTMMKENVHELFDIVSVARGAGVDCLVYHPVIVSQADMQSTIKGGHLWITPDLLGVLKDQIDQLMTYKNENGLVAFMHDPYQWLGYFQGTLTRNDWKCNPFVFVDIGPDGSVRSCGPSFGNIKDMSLKDCLHTDNARTARERMRICDKPCLQTCWSWPEGDSLKKIVDGFMEKLESSSLSPEEKKEVLEEAAALISKYEGLVIAKK